MLEQAGKSHVVSRLPAKYPRASSERTGQPVRRHSRPEGRSEGLFWRRITRGEANDIVQGAKRYDRALRLETGRRPLGPVALEILDYMAALAVLGGGKVYPSYDTLMRKLARSRDAIHRALKALRAHGFLDWLRRYVTTGDKGRGPQVQQTSNAYRLSLPARAARLLRKAPPLPDDFTHEKAQRAATTQAQLDSLDLVERTALEASGSGLEASLLKMARAIMSRELRESAPQTESPLKVL